MQQPSSPLELDKQAVALSFSPEGFPNKNEAGYMVFTSSEDCRAALRQAPVRVQVIVMEEGDMVTPINLAAALSKDCRERDIYLMAKAPSGSLTSRAKAAGVRGLINKQQAECLLGIETATKVAQEPRQVLSIPVALRSAGFTVGIVSGRGGVGKSTIALLLAVLAQQRNLRVALVDLDLQFGDLSFLAGQEPAHAIVRKTIEQSLDHRIPFSLHAGELVLVEGGALPEQAERLALQTSQLLEVLGAQADLVVVNTGSFWTEIQAVLAAKSTQLLFLMDQRASSIEGCRQAIELCIRLQAAQAKFFYVLNRCGSHAALSAQDVSLALGGVDVFALADGGPLVDELLSLGRPYELLQSKNPLVNSLVPLLDVLCEHLPNDTTSAPSTSPLGQPKSGVLARVHGILKRRGHVTP
jgi:pilus assembly protein CpaE